MNFIIQLTILIIGCTGVGKSELGYGLTHNPVFVAKTGADSVTLTTTSGSGWFLGNLINYYDPPGLNFGPTKDAETMNDIASFVKNNPSPNVVVIALNYQSPRYDASVDSMINLI